MRTFLQRPCFFLLGLIGSIALGQGLGSIQVSLSKYERSTATTVINDFSPEELKEQLEARPKVSLRAQFPTPGDQGSDATSVGWAVAYVKSYQEAQEREAFPARMLSPAYVYNQVGSNDCKGAELPDALRVVQLAGIADLGRFPVRLGDCSRKPTSQLQDDSRRNRIVGYDRLPTDPIQAIQSIKAMLLKDQPVIVSLQVSKSFVDHKQGDYRASRTERVIGQHAMVVTGFDESRKAFELINSWGRGWGDGGYVWISYDSFLYMYTLSERKGGKDVLYGVGYVLRDFIDAVTNLDEFVRRAQQGGVVRLGKGTFNLPSTLTLTKSVTIIGSGMDSTIVNSFALDVVVAYKGPGKLVLRDLTVEHLGQTIADVMTIDAEEAELIRVNIRGALGQQRVAYYGGIGLQVSGKTRVYVRDSIFEKNQAVGIKLLDTSSANILLSRFLDNQGGWGHGMSLWGEAKATVSFSRFVGNNFGILCSVVTQAEIFRNTFEDNKRNSVYITMYSVATIENNKITFSGESGVAFIDSASGVISGNVIQSSTFQGIFLGGRSTARMFNNVLEGSGEYGIGYPNTARPQIGQNTFRNNKLGDVGRLNP